MSQEAIMRTFAREHPLAFGDYIGRVGKEALRLKDEYGNAAEAMDMAFALTETPAGFPGASATPTNFETNLVRVLLGMDS